jgi:hypothetical protein
LTEVALVCARTLCQLWRILTDFEQIAKALIGKDDNGKRAAQLGQTMARQAGERIGGRPVNQRQQREAERGRRGEKSCARDGCRVRTVWWLCDLMTLREKTKKAPVCSAATDAFFAIPA